MQSMQSRAVKEPVRSSYDLGEREPAGGSIVAKEHLHEGVAERRMRSVVSSFSGRPVASSKNKRTGGRPTSRNVRTSWIRPSKRPSPSDTSAPGVESLRARRSGDVRSKWRWRVATRHEGIAVLMERGSNMKSMPSNLPTLPFQIRLRDHVGRRKLRVRHSDASNLRIVLSLR